MGRGPSSLNWFTFLLLIGLAAAGYGFWKFGPHYFTAYQVSHTLANAAARTYRVARLAEPARSQGIADIEAEARRHIVHMLHVDDPGLEVQLLVEGDKAIASAAWQVTVVHPKVNKRTVLRFNRRAVQDIKQVQW